MDLVRPIVFDLNLYGRVLSCEIVGIAIPGVGQDGQLDLSLRQADAGSSGRAGNLQVRACAAAEGEECQKEGEARPVTRECVPG